MPFQCVSQSLYLRIAHLYRAELDRDCAVNIGRAQVLGKHFCTAISMRCAAAFWFTMECSVIAPLIRRLPPPMPPKFERLIM